MLLIINNSKRISGTTVDFVIRLEPSITFNKVALKYASISNPSNNTFGYYAIRIDEFTPNVRGARNTDISATFIVPVISAGGTRNMYAENSLYGQVATCDNLTLNQLHVKIFTPDRNLVSSDENIILILQLD
jgi:hypothetical protein